MLFYVMLYGPARVLVFYLAFNPVLMFFFFKIIIDKVVYIENREIKGK